jgi:two-component system, cell cycle sensor histidine kinase and response regulator CckA
MNGMKILCVENQPDNLGVLTFMLEGIGYEVMPATDGTQAVDMFSKESVDGVLLEYNLPDSSGVEVREQLKAMRPDVPVLLFAGVGNQTPFMLRFFDAYLRRGQPFGDSLADEA